MNCLCTLLSCSFFDLHVNFLLQVSDFSDWYYSFTNYLVNIKLRISKFRILSNNFSLFSFNYYVLFNMSISCYFFLFLLTTNFQFFLLIFTCLYIISYFNYFNYFRNMTLIILNYSILNNLLFLFDVIIKYFSI